MIANVINNNSKLIESRDKNNEKKKKANKKQKKYKKNKVAMNPEKNIKNEEISISKKNSNDIGSDSNESFPKYDQEPLKRSHEKIKEEIILDIKKSLSCDESKLFPINPNDIPNDFIEVKKKNLTQAMFPKLLNALYVILNKKNHNQNSIMMVKSSS